MHLNHEFVVPVPIEQAWNVLLDVERIAPCLPGATLDSIEGESFTGRVKVKVGPITVTYKGTAKFLQRDEESRRATIMADGREARGSGTAAATVEVVMRDEGERTRVTLDTDLAVTGRPAQFGRGVMVDVSNKLLGMFADCLERTLAADQTALVAAAGVTEAVAGESAAAPVEAVAGEPAAPAVAPVGPVPGESAAAPVETVAGEPAAPAVAVPDEPAVAPGPSAVPSAVRPQAARPTPEAIDLLGAAGVPILKRALPAVSAVVVLVLLWRILRRIRS